MLWDAYALQAVPVEHNRQSWREFDGFVFDNLAIWTAAVLLQWKRANQSASS